MFEIKGTVTTALCFAKVAEEEAIEQIRRMCSYPLTFLAGVSAEFRICFSITGPELMVDVNARYIEGEFVLQIEENIKKA